MPKRIIVQAAFAPEGLVIKVTDGLSQDELSKAVLAALPAEHAAADLNVSDEADDDVETREFGEDEDLLHGRVLHVGHCLKVAVKVRYAGRIVD